MGFLHGGRLFPRDKAETARSLKATMKADIAWPLPILLVKRNHEAKFKRRVEHMHFQGERNDSSHLWVLSNATYTRIKKKQQFSGGGVIIHL